MRITTAILTVIWAAFAQAQEVRRAIPVGGSSVVVEASSANEVAKFLAGVSLPEGSRLSAWQRMPEYREHVDSLARLSQRYDRHFFSKMREWSAAELAPRIPMGLPVFYFFSGPDAVSPLALYPQAPVYLLGGLEPVGSLPDPGALPRGEVAVGLQNLRKSTEVILSFGHFITKDMKAELDRTAIRGVAPVICTFIALAGGEVLSVRFVKLSSQGIAESGAGRGHPGVRIDFRRRAAANPQTIYYVQANVADDALKSDGSLLAWARGFGRGNVYLKAASYLPHEAYFSRIREFLLGSAASILQDDSGIPFRYFRNGEWRCWFFGAYTGTLDIFTKYFQPDLGQAFASGGAAPLPFGFGYKWREGESNLLLAVRQGPAAPAADFPAAMPAGTPMTP